MKTIAFDTLVNEVRALTLNNPIACASVPAFLALGLLVRTLSAAILVDPAEAFSWWTPAVENGLLAGGLILLPAIFLPAAPRLILAAIALLLGAVLVNITPPNPHSIVALASWRQGHFLNFNGLTRIISIFWPFLALPYLFFASPRSPADRSAARDSPG